MNVKKIIAFIVFASVSCMVAMASAIWERGRKFVHVLLYIPSPARGHGAGGKEG